MIPKEFDYVAPNSLEEALQALQEGGEDAKVLAGGHSLIPLMKLRLAEPSLLVDLRNIGSLARIGGDGGGLELGAMVTYYNMQTTSDVAGEWPLLTETAASIGDRQVRARGTIGGSLAHADPAADMPAAVLALDGTLVAARLQGSNGTSGVSTREIPAADFFVDMLTSALEPGEILTTIRLPRRPERTGSAYVKIRNKASHYALVGAAAVLGMDADGTCNYASVALSGAATRPFRMPDVESALKGTRLQESDISNALGKVGSEDVDWMSDLFGSEEYRKHLAGVVASRAVNLARERVTGGR